MRNASLTLLLAFLLAGCAGTGGVTERRYARDLLPQVPLKSLDVVVVAKGPPLATGRVLEFEPIQAPRLEAALLGAIEEDGPTRDALAARLADQLARFDVRIFHAGAEAAPTPDSPKPVTALPPIQTSTAVMTSTAATVMTSTASQIVVTPPAPPPPRRPRVPMRPLASETTLKELLAASQADGVLVVRVVVVDEFQVHPERTNADFLDDAGRPQVAGGQTSEPTVFRGRLLIGQAFLFDRKTGLRLWSRQLPDFPENGEIINGSRILQYGTVFTDSAAVEPAERAARAADGFAEAMFSDFPAPTEGAPSARAQLDAIDVEAELRQQRFYDESRVLLELELGWAAERSGSSLQLAEEPLPDVGTGAVSPSGIGRVGARIGYMSPSGFTYMASAQFGVIPGGFARTYHRDSGSAGTDFSANVDIDGGNTFAVELGIGYALLVADGLVLLPAVDVFLDVWSLDAGPPGVVIDRTHLRAGGALNLDVLYSLTDLFYARLGVGARAGFDTGGPALVGGNLSLGVGLFL